MEVFFGGSEMRALRARFGSDDCVHVPTKSLGRLAIQHARNAPRKALIHGISHVLTYSPLCLTDSRLRQVPVHSSATLNKSAMAEKTTNGRKVLIAVDGSEHSDRAFECE